MSTPEFNYQEPFPLGKDESEYYLLTKDHVSVSQFEGETMDDIKGKEVASSDISENEEEFIYFPCHRVVAFARS